MDQNRTNPAANKEKAEGSRENAGAGAQGESTRRHYQPGGITNRPLDEERENQEEVPPRGRHKDEL